MGRHSLRSCLKWKAGGVCTLGREHREIYISLYSSESPTLTAAAAAAGGLSLSPCRSRGPTGSRGDRGSRGRRCWDRFQAPPPRRCCLHCSRWAPGSSARPPPSRRWWGCCGTTADSVKLILNRQQHIRATLVSSSEMTMFLSLLLFNRNIPLLLERKLKTLFSPLPAGLNGQVVAISMRF